MNLPFNNAQLYPSSYARSATATFVHVYMPGSLFSIHAGDMVFLGDPEPETEDVEPTYDTAYVDRHLEWCLRTVGIEPVELVAEDYLSRDELLELAEYYYELRFHMIIGIGTYCGVPLADLTNEHLGYLCCLMREEYRRERQG